MTKRRQGMVRQGARGWYAQASVVAPDGTRSRPRQGPFPTRQEAADALAVMLGDIAARRWVAPDRTPVGTYLTDWLAAHRVSLKPSTAAGYAGVLRRYVVPAIGHVTLADLRASHLSRLYADLAARGLSPRTVRTVHVVARRGLQQAVTEGTLMRNPADGAVLPRPVHREMPAWSADEAAAFVAATRDDPMHALFVLALATGMRRGELAGLRWEDVALDDAQVHVRRTRVVVDGVVTDGEPKTNTSRRTVDLDPYTVTALRRWRVRQGPSSHLVFPFYPDTLSERWDAAVKLAGVPRITIHGARHTAATLMLNAGVPITTVSRRLGHAGPQVTLSVYSHVVGTDAKDAADRLGSVIFGNGTGNGAS